MIADGCRLDHPYEQEWLEAIQDMRSFCLAGEGSEDARREFFFYRLSELSRRYPAISTEDIDAVVDMLILMPDIVPEPENPEETVMLEILPENGTVTFAYSAVDGVHMIEVSDNGLYELVESGETYVRKRLNVEDLPWEVCARMALMIAYEKVDSNTRTYEYVENYDTDLFSTNAPMHDDQGFISGRQVTLLQLRNLAESMQEGGDRSEVRRRLARILLNHMEGWRRRRDGAFMTDEQFARFYEPQLYTLRNELVDVVGALIFPRADLPTERELGVPIEDITIHSGYYRVAIEPQYLLTVPVEDDIADEITDPEVRIRKESMARWKARQTPQEVIKRAAMLATLFAIGTLVNLHLPLQRIQAVSPAYVDAAASSLNITLTPDSSLLQASPIKVQANPVDLRYIAAHSPWILKGIDSMMKQEGMKSWNQLTPQQQTQFLIAFMQTPAGNRLLNESINMAIHAPHENANAMQTIQALNSLIAQGILTYANGHYSIKRLSSREILYAVGYLGGLERLLNGYNNDNISSAQFASAFTNARQIVRAA